MKKLALIGLLLSTLAVPAFASVDPPAVVGAATLTATGQTLVITNAFREGFAMQLNSLTGTAGLQVQGSVDGSTWTTLLVNKAGSSTVSLTATASGCYVGNAAGFKHLRISALYITAGYTLSALLSWGSGFVGGFPTIAVTPVP